VIRQSNLSAAASPRKAGFMQRQNSHSRSNDTKA